MSSEVHAKCTHSSCGSGRAARLQRAADPIFHRLHVVIGARLDLLDGRDIGGCRILAQRGEQVPGRARQLGECRCGRSRGERQEPGALHADALAHQSSLAEQIADRRQLARVSAVEG